MKNAIWMMLPTIGGISRNRAQIAPSSTVTASESASHTTTPGMASSPSVPGHDHITMSTTMITSRLCARIRMFRSTIRAAYSVNGILTARIRLSLKM